MTDRIPPPELDADTRAAVLQVRALYLAYVQTGFSTEQALELVKAHLSAAARGKGES